MIKPITAFGVGYKSLAAMSRALGLNVQTVSTRINRLGMSIEDAVSAESRYRGNKAHPNYGTWTAMRNRCTRPELEGYKNYGGRGITVCDRWMNDFWAFVSDMGTRPSSKHTIERVDNSKGYSPDNCKWATRREQSLNQRKNVFITFNGETLCVTDWARRLGVADATLAYRLRNWPLSRALTVRPAIPRVEQP